MEACKDTARQFLPSLKDFFDEAIEQLDPANQVEKQYHLSNQTDWSWKALRLLAKRSAFYFMQNQNVKTISEYLEAICNKLSKEFSSEQQQLAQQQQIQLQQSQKQLPNPIHVTSTVIENIENENSQLGNDDESVQIDDEQTTNVNNSMAGQTSTINVDLDQKLIEHEIKSEPLIDENNDNNESMNTSLARNDLEMPGTPQETTQVKIEVFNAELIDLISENIQSVQEWKNIATFLKMDAETISFIENENQDLRHQCTKILQLWKVKILFKNTFQTFLSN